MYATQRQLKSRLLRTKKPAPASPYIHSASFPHQQATTRFSPPSRSSPSSRLISSLGLPPSPSLQPKQNHLIFPGKIHNPRKTNRLQLGKWWEFPGNSVGNTGN